VAKLIVPAECEQLDRVIDFVNAILDENGCGVKHTIQLDTAVEEIFVNIASYAYIDKKGNVEIECLFGQDGCVSVIFSDSGFEYNPLTREPPDITLSAEERNIGGLGILMVKKTMDSVEYLRENEKNILKISKRIVAE